MDFKFTSPFIPPAGTSNVVNQGPTGTMTSQQQNRNQQPQPPSLFHPPGTSATQPTFNLPSLTTFDTEGVNPDNPYDRVSVKKSRGVGSTRQWRDRLITQVEDKIKETRASIQNSRRTGLSRTTSTAGQSEPSSSQEYLSSQNLGNESFEASTLTASQASESGLTDEEHMRLVAEVWESFKRENYEELARDLEGMSDQDIVNMEREILQYNYTTDYDPIYDAMMDMEEQDMDETIEQYMRMDETQQQGTTTIGGSIQDETTVALSLAMTLLSQRSCIRCQSAPLQFETMSSSASSSSNTSAPRALCGQCGLCLERDMLLYVGGSARNHSLGCAGPLQFTNDEDTGLLILCTQCDFLA
ncbi:hypothetical protein BGZ83_001859 [Gryganskiella cystojenkinii]|nr:hypothetical protein BGZ83_001859 [Gryganskiella cystojenkinii]